MDLKQLSELGGEINVTVRLEDLRRWHEELTATAPPTISNQPNASELYTRKQTIDRLSVTPTSNTHSQRDGRSPTARLSTGLQTTTRSTTTCAKARSNPKIPTRT